MFGTGEPSKKKQKTQNESNVINTIDDLSRYRIDEGTSLKYSNPTLLVNGSKKKAYIAIVGSCTYSRMKVGGETIGKAVPGKKQFAVDPGCALFTVTPDNENLDLIDALDQLHESYVHDIKKNIPSTATERLTINRNGRASLQYNSKRNGGRSWEKAKLTVYKDDPSNYIDGNEAKSALIEGTQVKVICQVMWLYHGERGTTANVQIKKIVILEPSEENLDELDDLGV